MAEIRDENRFALYEGERQITDFIWENYYSLNDYIILSNANETWIYHRDTKSFTLKIKGTIYSYEEDEDWLMVEESGKYGVYSFDGNVILPVEFSKIDVNKSYFVVKDIYNLCGVFSITGEDIVPISFERIGILKLCENKDTIDAVSVTKEGKRGWYIIKRKTFIAADNVNFTKTGIVEVCKDDKWYILDDSNCFTTLNKI